MAYAINFSYGGGNIHCMNGAGSRIRQLRKQKGLTQVKLAALIGIDQSTLSDIESKGAGFGAETLARMCEELDTSLEYVMRGASPSMSTEARRIAIEFDQLSERQKRTFRALWTAYVREAAPDEQVAQHLPPAPTSDQLPT